ncbi:MAG: hypothetical protein M5U07_07500 [Xanthobacteraceae bacterium]|nr:hypothetical protein [Xanthobacteraceae bacterium]
MAAKGKRFKPRMKVNVSMQAWDLAKAGAAITLKIRDKGRLLGTVEIGQGSFGWKGAHGRGFRRIGWRALAERLDADR